MKSNVVAITRKKGLIYTDYPPYNPPFSYPEYKGSDHSLDVTNQVYDQVRTLFFQLAMDRDNYGNHNWNPLRELINPGDKVVIKPNFVLHFNDSGQDINAVITHGSVIRSVMDYVYIALKGKVRLLLQMPHR